ncbi:hypothetical protein CA984_20850 [Streptosporangium minutum]|uniref:Tn3 transposase DDE domain-containing protein n=1 Tax=Streptosporangium minutum TaxID=569862 RepID=A0A243RIZ6_9ACTN|nr:Tn3 family transposase [Streptosporangium minutum]OUC94829.1 hypothetical protein CA984_20850 [Streptosporangium minutum]
MLRHRPARTIRHGNGGKIRQAYREGREDRLAALGLVVNAVVLGNSTYLSAIVDHLRAQGWKSASEGASITDEDVARLFPLGHAPLHCLGRYAVTASDCGRCAHPPTATTTERRTDRADPAGTDAVR